MANPAAVTGRPSGSIADAPAGGADDFSLDDRDERLLAAIRAGATFEEPKSEAEAHELSDRLFKLSIAVLSRVAATAESAAREARSANREIAARNEALGKSQEQTRAMIEELVGDR